RHTADRSWQGNLLLRVLSEQSEGARHQCGARQAGVSGVGKIRSLGAERPTTCGRLLRSILAATIAVSRTSRLGNDVDGQPSRDLRRNIQNGKDSQARGSGGLAHLAQQFLQSDLPGGTGTASAIE